QTYFEELDQLFYGITPTESSSEAPEIVAPKPINTSITPQQTKKRPKRLASLAENEDNGDDTSAMGETVSQRSSLRKNNSQLLAVAQEEPEEELNTTGALMPPPPIPAPAHAIVSAPVAGTPAAETSMSGRPQRAAKLRSEKNLKEPSLHSKLRRPSNDELIKVKLECEQRASQAHLTHMETNVTRTEAAPLEVSQAKTKESSIAANTTGVRVMVKREKLSCDSSATLEATKTTLTDETTVLSNTTTVANSTATVAAVPAKRGRKKKEVCKPIKVERFSDLDKPLPVSSRTRQGSNGGARNSQESQAPSQRSIYEDAIEEAAPQGAAVVNKTMTLPNVGNVEATGNATVTLNSDATFQVADDRGDDEKEESMETARQGSMPKTGQENSLLTDDESIVDVNPSKNMASKMPPAALKATKMATRAHELFNPLLQSPVKMRVEAFENAANAQSTLRSKRVKEVAASGSNTTPVIGKLPAPALGRFLTPTQSATALPVSSSVGKKAPLSAKAAPLMKANTMSTSSKTLSRENSGDDFRKGLHQLAEERKKQREQKHLQAAQQREVKERERAERLAKLAKEREEKRLKKEKMEERKRQEMEELQRKMQQQDEAERLKKAKLKEQEREMLHHMKMQQNSAKAMMPPPPKSKYTFEMLHEDDSTDDEGKVSHKRPPVPNWSRCEFVLKCLINHSFTNNQFFSFAAHVRGPAISMQSHCPTDVIDSFFSVEPTTPDLKQIFPNIDPSHLKRNSSVLWSTPPRYSELPKY
ncbi:hypothetical protein KR215_009631, partial [Drosophila sulfurigaster]